MVNWYSHWIIYIDGDWLILCRGVYSHSTPPLGGEVKNSTQGWKLKKKEKKRKQKGGGKKKNMRKKKNKKGGKGKKGKKRGQNGLNGKNYFKRRIAIIISRVSGRKFERILSLYFLMEILLLSQLFKGREKTWFHTKNIKMFPALPSGKRN